jgi:hypothetical protein
MLVRDEDADTRETQMLMVCHHLSRAIRSCPHPCLASSFSFSNAFPSPFFSTALPLVDVHSPRSARPSTAEDIAFAESRIRAETVAAEDVLQDLGAISIISSDSQAMVRPFPLPSLSLSLCPIARRKLTGKTEIEQGRIGEVASRSWRTASKMKECLGPLKEEKVDNERVKVRIFFPLSVPSSLKPSSSSRLSLPSSLPYLLARSATSPNTPSTLPSLTESLTSSGTSNLGNSPIWCCGIPHSLA